MLDLKSKDNSIAIKIKDVLLKLMPSIDLM